MKQEVKSLEALLNKTVLTMNGAEFLELLHQVKRTEVKEEKKQSSLNDYRDLPQFITGIKGLAKVLGISVSTVNRMKTEGLLDDAIFQNGKTVIFDTYNKTDKRNDFHLIYITRNEVFFRAHQD